MPSLVNNRKLAVKRLEDLKIKCLGSEQSYNNYCTFMSDITAKGYTEVVPQEDQNKNARVWYILHHGVYHHQRIDQLCVVLDCIARHRGVSLNETLFQAPDLTNPLVDVMQRFQ